ncbi:Predicted functional analog of homoserine kinase [hydrothermal vent metagenome]|uniref:Predicted functional analog of homoserine kinase n=1 Tax=hydrothermal vent metagenome TaxID=652676 RepID=A0A3B1BUE8_9ZZZZ
MRKQKYVILLGDGMPDRTLPELDNRTPLMVAKTPNLDFMAREGTVGSARTTPEGFEPGSDVTNMGILGYDPNSYYTGRAPLEAAAMGVELAPDDVAFRCNLVSLRRVGNGAVMEDFSAGHIETEPATELINALDEELGSDEISFHPGVSYRHLMVWKGGMTDCKLTPPHDISGQNIADHMPGGKGAPFITKLMGETQIFLHQHKTNARLKAEGKKVANSAWFWGQGKAPTMPSLRELYGLGGAMISAVDLMRGIGVYAGMRIIKVPGATGWIDTNYEGKARACLEALKDVDMVYLHVESPDEAGHAGSLEYKIQAISDFDRKVVGPVLEGLKGRDDYRVMAISDHATPLEVKTHTLDPVPFAIYPPPADAGSVPFDESILESSQLKFDSAIEISKYFIEGEK